MVSGPGAARLAGVSYRQLDHWARQGWAAPSACEGRARRYTVGDVARVCLLRHVGQSGLNLSRLGPQLAGLELSGAGWVIIDAADTVTVVPADAGTDGLAELVGRPGLRCVFDAAACLDRLDRRPRSGTGDAADGAAGEAAVLLRKGA
ncbi:MAG: MerR family transcriptional regulator [Acidimicrobiales bacterium]